MKQYNIEGCNNLSCVEISIQAPIKLNRTKTEMEAKKHRIPSKNHSRLCQQWTISKDFSLCWQKCPNLGAHLPQKLNNQAEQI